MRPHHDKHHQTYVTNANDALDGTDRADKPPPEGVQNVNQISDEKRDAARNDAGGHYNHSLLLGVDVSARRRRARRRTARRAQQCVWTTPGGTPVLVLESRGRPAIPTHGQSYAARSEVLTERKRLALWRSDRGRRA